jgi:AraC-like DNA-binding protein
MKAFHEVRNYNADLKVWSSQYTNISFLAHWHKEIELIYIRSGSAKISITDQNFVAHAGDLVICDSGNIHYSDSYGMDNCLDFILFDSNLISSRYQRSNFDHSLITKAELETYELTAPLHQLFHITKYELQHKEEYYQKIVSANIQAFWYLLLRRLPKANEERSRQSKRLNMLDDLQQLLDFIENHYMENITLQYAASQMHFSESHFSKIFKKLTGINFVNYINTVRIENAANLIKTTNQRMTDIALACGFNNVRSFNRVFKEVTGYTPSEFSLLPDAKALNVTYTKHRPFNQEFVENDSITIRKNDKKLS